MVEIRTRTEDELIASIKKLIKYRREENTLITLKVNRKIQLQNKPWNYHVLSLSYW